LALSLFAEIMFFVTGFINGFGNIIQLSDSSSNNQLFGNQEQN